MQKYNICKEIVDAEIDKIFAQYIISKKEKDVEIIHYILLFFLHN